MVTNWRKIGLFVLWIAFGASICGSMGCGCARREPIFQRPGLIIPK